MVEWMVARRILRQGCVCFLVFILAQACVGQQLPAQVSQPTQIPSIEVRPTVTPSASVSPNYTEAFQLTDTPGNSGKAPVEVVETPTPFLKDPEGYPKLANLWGVYELPADPEVYAGFDLFIPYTLLFPAAQVELVRKLNPNIVILHNQYASKGRPEFSPLFQEWWDSKPGDPGYACFLRDSKGIILLVKVWKHPMVNMTNPSCRQAMVQKNVDDFKASSIGYGTRPTYDGIYWDLMFDRITWLGSDIDSNVDGVADNPDLLNKAYQQGMIEFLTKLRASLPTVILAGNEASLGYSALMDGRLFEWQLSTLFAGEDFLRWDEVIQEYRAWTVQANNRHITIIQSSPSQTFADKFPGDDLERIPAETMAEAQASYQRMRYGLVSALMGDGYFSFDFGPMIHGFPWWYDEYGAPMTARQSSLPPRGYLGTPKGDPFQMEGVSGVWARAFEHGLAVINPGLQVRKVSLPGAFCKIDGSQAPLFETTVDDDQAEVFGGWESMPALLNQFGRSVQVATGIGNSSILYTPSLAYSGTYEVFVWVSPAEGQSSVVDVSILSASGEAAVHLDESTGSIGWRSIGVYQFNPDQASSVRIFAGANGIVVADAVKWSSTARYNDGSIVNMVILQPQDGIILQICKL